MDTQIGNFIFITVTIVVILAFLGIKLLANKLFHKNGVKKYHPIGGTMFHHLRNFKKLHHCMTDLAAKYKTYRILTPFRNEVYTSDPANVEYILKTNFDNYGKGYYNYDNLNDLLGDGIFTVDGEKWRNQRKVSSHEFSTRMLRDYSSKIFRTNAVKLADIISYAANSDQIMDIQDLFMKSTLDSIFKVALGVDLDSMCGSNEEGKKFGQAFDDASASTMLRYVDIFWPIKKFLNIGAEAKLKRSVKIVDEFVYKLISNKVELMKSSQCNDSEMQMKKDDILSRFLEQSDTDLKYLRDIILSFVIAGKDTTAVTLSWFVYMLCKHQNIQENVAEEYLHAALTETLRLYPAVPMDPKMCFSNDTLPDGYSVNKGDTVAYQPYAMGRMSYIWGDDAEDFRPERWLSKDGIFQPENPFKFTAFQAGPRICLGKEFAYRQMKIIAAVLLSSFIFKLGDEKSTVTYRTMINLHVDGGLHIRALYR
uniref:Cytochrome P450 704C1-like n=1 Tax=Chenopodium quinoa TaxID=63459 RepID=A0A803KYY3_CHEQI